MATETCLVCGGAVNSGSGVCEGCGHKPYGEVVGEATEAPAPTYVNPPAPAVPNPPAPKAGLPTVSETCIVCNSTVDEDGVCSGCGHRHNDNDND